MTGGVDRHKLGKCLALLASPVAGEAAAAAAMVCKLLAQAGLRPENLATFTLPAPAAPVSYTKPGAWTWNPTGDATRYESMRPKSPRYSFRDLGPRAARQLLDDLLNSQPFPLLPKHVAFVRDIRERMCHEPHVGLTTAEVRRLNMLWRAWRDMQTRCAT